MFEDFYEIKLFTSLAGKNIDISLWLVFPDYNLQPQLAFYQQGNNTRVTFMSIILPTQL